MSRGSIGFNKSFIILLHELVIVQFIVYLGAWLSTLFQVSFSRCAFVPSVYFPLNFRSNPGNGDWGQQAYERCLPY